MTNCCWGAAELAQVLGREAAEKGCRIAETSGQLILANSPGPGQVYLKTREKADASGLHRPRRHRRGAGSALPRMAPVYRRLQHSRNLPFRAPTPSPTGPIALFNLARMDNGEDYRLFADGLSPLTARFVEQLDTERVTVARACGVPCAPRWSF